MLLSLKRSSRLLLFVGLAAIASAVPAPAQSAAPIRLDLNIPTLRLLVYEGDEVLRSYPVSVGLMGHDTPTGEYTVDHAEWNPWWRPPARDWAKDEKITPPGPNNPMGRVKLFFAPLYFIHGTPNAASIGTPASHGCVRMKNSDVIALARLLHERGGASVTGKQIDAIVAKPTANRTVHLKQPVPLSITYMPVVVEEGELAFYPDIYKRSLSNSEGIYQALLMAGYDVAGVDRQRVDAMLDGARGHKKGIYRAGVETLYGDGVAIAR